MCSCTARQVCLDPPRWWSPTWCRRKGSVGIRPESMCRRGGIVYVRIRPSGKTCTCGSVSFISSWANDAKSIQYRNILNNISIKYRRYFPSVALFFGWTCFWGPILYSFAILCAFASESENLQSNLYFCFLSLNFLMENPRVKTKDSPYVLFFHPQV